MADVAKLAGVSHQTVSRVINGSTQVRPETRERVLAAMPMLDYRPNSVARALATGRSRTLGVVGFDTTLYGPASTLFGIERAAHEAGYFISTVACARSTGRRSSSAVERLRVQGVDGILVIAPQTDAAHAVLQLPGGPAGRRGRGRARRRHSACVAVDQSAGAVAGDPASARARARHRLAHRRARGLARGAAARRRLAAGAAGGGSRAAAGRCTATGARSRATSSAATSPPTPTSPRSSPPTTRWRSGCCGRCTRRAGRSPARSASSASTTSRRPRSSRRR